MSDTAPWSLQTRSPLLATYTLLVVLLVVHIVTGAVWVIGNEGSAVSAWVTDRGPWMRMEVGGQHRIPLRRGELWRLCTSVLLHGDLLHLGVNAVSLYALGRMLEPTLGALRWMAWFVIGGTLASLGCWCVGVIQSDGASGGAFALLAAGVWLGLMHRSRWDPHDRKLMGPVLLIFLVVNFAIGWLIPGIDAIAHTIGLLVGLGLAAVDPVSRRWRGLYAAICAAFAVVCAVGWTLLVAAS